jgi:putative transposase
MFLTARLDLRPTPDQARLFADTAALFHRGLTHAAAVAHAEGVTRAVPLQKLAYAALKALGLGAQHVCLACRVVGDAYKVGDKTKPREFRKGGAVPMDGRTFSLSGDVASVWTLAGRVKVKFTCGPRQRKLLLGKHKQADLVCHQGRWALLVAVEAAESPLAPAGEFLGVDLGVANVAVDSTGEAFSGEQVKRVRRRRAKARQTWQRRKAGGSRSARRRLREMAGRERRFQRWANHGVAKRLVEKARAMALGLALESLTGLGKRRATASKPLRKILGRWAFSQLRLFVEYKARLAGVRVVLVDPAYTSQTCSACGVCDKASRKSQSEYECVGCGFSAHADHNAATNVAARALVSAPHKPAARGRGKGPRP